jgi:ABC-type phosphate transport system substrate-binding protein
LAVFVNEKNPLQEITLADLRGIYTGKLTRWGDVAHAGRAAAASGP